MANAAAKRIAQQNEKGVQVLKLGIILPTLLSILFRVLLGRGYPSKSAAIVYLLTFCPAFFLSNYLVKIGTSRKDPTTGTIIGYGEDLSQPGVIEWCFDILYVTWFCQIGSAFSEWFWWFYLVIPLYAILKLLSFAWPMLFGGASSSSKVENGTPSESTSSKRQDKLRKRSERGDPRVQSSQKVRK